MRRASRPWLPAPLTSSFRERLDTFFSILAAVFSAPRPFFSFLPFLPIAPVRSGAERAPRKASSGARRAGNTYPPGPTRENASLPSRPRTRFRPACSHSRGLGAGCVRTAWGPSGCRGHRREAPGLPLSRRPAGASRCLARPHVVTQLGDSSHLCCFLGPCCKLNDCRHLTPQKNVPTLSGIYRLR